jgi:hypothetical protein
VHARTKLVDVYDVRPVNAEEEGLQIGPYCYTSFPPLNQDLERVAVVNEISLTDVPDISQLVTVDVESISGSARRDSRDSATGSDSGRRQSIEHVRVDDIGTVSCEVGRERDYGSDSSDHDNHNDLQQEKDRSTDDQQEAAGSICVSIESIVAPFDHSDSSVSGQIRIDSGHLNVVADSEEAESPCDPVDEEVAEDTHCRPRMNPSEDLGTETDTRPGDVVLEDDNESSGVISGEHSHSPAEIGDDSFGSHRFGASSINVCSGCTIVFCVRMLSSRCNQVHTSQQITKQLRS